MLPTAVAVRMHVDLVYTWVNSTDRTLAEQRAAFSAREVKRNFNYRAGQARFQDNGELRYSLRSVEKNLPFVRRVHVVHAGARPDWLRHDMDDLRFVSQDEILPPGISPSFQSDVVEAYLYRLPGLSEHYVYANDDFMFALPHRPGDFFDAEGRALVGRDWRLAGTRRTVVPIYRSMELNAARAVRRRLGTLVTPAPNTPPWKTRLKLLFHRAAWLNTVTHVAQPFRRSIWEGFHDTFATEMRALAEHRFRSRRGMTVNLMAHHYAMAAGKARFVEREHGYLQRGDSAEAAERFRQSILHNLDGWPRFCLNDAPAVDRFDWNGFVASFTNEYMPNRSRWEV